MNHKAHEMTVLKAGGVKPPVLPKAELMAVVRTLAQYANAFAADEQYAVSSLLTQAAGCLDSAVNYWGDTDTEGRSTSA